MGDSALHDGVIIFDAGAPRRAHQVDRCRRRQLVAQVPAPRNGMIHAAKVLAGSAMDLLADSALLRLATEEFRERTNAGCCDPSVAPRPSADSDHAVGGLLPPSLVVTVSAAVSKRSRYRSTSAPDN